MKKLLILISAVTIITAETSVFKSTSIESKKQYGFTETEQFIYDNKEEISDLKVQLNKISNNLEEQSSAQGGMRPIVRTNSQKISTLEKNIESISTNISNLTKYLTKLEETIATLEKRVSDLEKQNSDFNNTIARLEKDLATKATKKNLKDVTAQVLKEINKNRAEMIKLGQLLEIKKPNVAFRNEDPEQLLRDVKDLMTKRDYEAARVRLNYLVDNDEISQARVLYFLGEVEYQTANYEKAARAFKASGALDSKANYMPTLLYHAGVAFQKIDDKESARQFFQTLIDNYPKSYLVKGAKGRLEAVK